jgi:group I intron endonuclease
MTSFYKIYIVTNLINLKKYVGQTVQAVLRRWQQHKSAAKTKKILHFHRAINKYGPENFKIEWLASAFTKEDANYLEEQWIREFKTYLPEFGYNSTYGGEEARLKMAAAWVKRRAKNNFPTPVDNPQIVV